MSRRSILLATTVCVALGTSVAASAHGSGGGGFRFADAPSLARVSSLPATLAEHAAPIAHTKVMTKASPQFTYHKVFKAGNGVTPTSDPTTHTIGTITTKPTVTPAVNQPPQVATQSVPPTPIKVGTIVDKPSITPVGYGVGAGALATKPVVPSTAFPPPTVTTPGNPVGNGVPPSPIKVGTIVDKPSIPEVGLGLKVLEPGPVSTGTLKPGTLADKPTIPAAGFGDPGIEILKTGPAQSPQPATPSQTSPMHPMPGVLGGGVVVAVGDVDLTDVGGTCYWIKRKLLTEDGEVLRRVKVCEVIDSDQP